MFISSHSDRARSIMYGNNSEYEYCLWSFAARSICTATTVSMNKDNRNSFAKPSACCVGQCYELNYSGARQNHRQSKHTAFAKPSACCVGQCYELNYSGARQNHRQSKHTAFAKPSACTRHSPSLRLAHGIRQAFVLHTAFAKPSACTKPSPILSARALINYTIFVLLTITRVF